MQWKVGRAEVGYYIWNGPSTRSYCVAQITIVTTLMINHNGKENKKKNICI